MCRLLYHLKKKRLSSQSLFEETILIKHRIIQVHHLPYWPDLYSFFLFLKQKINIKDKIWEHSHSHYTKRVLEVIQPMKTSLEVCWMSKWLLQRKLMQHPLFISVFVNTTSVLILFQLTSRWRSTNRICLMPLFAQVSIKIQVWINYFSDILLYICQL